MPISNSENFDEIWRIQIHCAIISAVDPQRLVSAALRLKHDLGKAVRWNAPAERERDSEALRRRLDKDLLQTRTGGDGEENAVSVFDAWMAENGPLFRGLARYEQRLARVREAVETVRSLLPRLPELGPDELVALDEASLRLYEESRGLWQDVLSTESGGPAA
jgi:hypothetical protein